MIATVPARNQSRVGGDKDAKNMFPFPSGRVFSGSRRPRHGPGVRQADRANNRRECESGGRDSLGGKGSSRRRGPPPTRRARGGLRRRVWWGGGGGGGRGGGGGSAPGGGGGGTPPRLHVRGL